MPKKRLLIVGNIDVPEIERLADLGYAAEVVGSIEDAAHRLASGDFVGVISDGGVIDLADGGIVADVSRAAGFPGCAIGGSTEDALRRCEERFQALTEAMPHIVWSADSSGIVDYYNRWAFEYAGVPPGERDDWDWAHFIHPDDLAETLSSWWHAVEAGKIQEIEHRLLRADGEYRWHLTRGLPIRDAHGRVTRWIGTATDVHDQKSVEETLRKTLRELDVRAEELESLNEELAVSRDTTEEANVELRAFNERLQSEIEQRRQVDAELHRLNRTLNALSHSDRAMMRATDESAYLQEVCRIVVEDCGHAMVWIGFAEDDGGKLVRPVASSGFEAGYLETLNLTWADTRRGRGPTGTAIRTGKPSMCRNMLTDPKFAPWRAAALRRGYASSIVLPLVADDKAFGALSIYSREADPFSEDEIELLVELANDLAYGITSIRLRDAHAHAQGLLYEREHRIADVLQKALIPETICAVPGVDIAAKYEPAMAEAEVGGDFYDVFQLEENKVGILIGDVSGKGLAAAVRVAAARHAIRSYAFLDPAPGRVMTLSNNALCRDAVEGAQMITALFVVIDAADGRMTCANGGHEYPLIRRADGSIEDFEVQGRALGMVASYDYEEIGIVLRPQDTVVMFTDGITEARPGGSLFFGFDGVRACLAEHRGKPIDVIASALLDAAKSHSNGALKDDAAIVIFSMGDRSLEGGEAA